jgi:RNA polymerase sigma-70 factor (ECF subfamily)
VNDAELRERLASFYAIHWRRLWAFVCRMGADAAMAQDVAQDAFARWALSQAPGWDDRRAKAYLYAIAARAFIDQNRRRRRDSPLEEGLTRGLDGVADRPLAGAWSRLSQRDRELLWLAYAEEFSHDDIARITGLKPASIKVLLSRARDRARSSLSGDGS